MDDELYETAEWNPDRARLFGEMAKKARKRAGLTKVQMAKKMNADVSFIESIENGDYPQISDFIIKGLTEMSQRPIHPV